MRFVVTLLIGFILSSAWAEDRRLIDQDGLVRALRAGVVTHVGAEAILELIVESVHIRHPDGFTTTYAGFAASLVRLGELVDAGAVIAKMSPTTKLYLGYYTGTCDVLLGQLPRFTFYDRRPASR